MRRTAPGYFHAALSWDVQVVPEATKVNSCKSEDMLAFSLTSINVLNN
jgi:hypothetical protein